MQRNNMATAALVAGIVSIIGAILFGIGFIPGLLGITFALLSRRPRMNSSATTGLMLSVIGTVLSTIIVVCLLTFISSPEFEYRMNEYLEEFTDDLELDPDNSIYDFNEYYQPENNYGFDEYYDYYDSYDDYFDNFSFGYNDDYNKGGPKL